MKKHFETVVEFCNADKLSASFKGEMYVGYMVKCIKYEITLIYNIYT